MNRIDLNGKWTGAVLPSDDEKGFSFAGTVPGCIHTDLIKNGILDDIYYRDNSEKCQWVENRDFSYTRKFCIDTLPSRAALVFEGLDTYTEIFLNGKSIGKTDNMFIRHTFDVREYLTVGENEISVYFRSPVKEVEGLPLYNGAFTRERMRTRRIQCTYGWDWVERFVTSGIWRDVYLDTEDGFRVKNAYICTEALIGTTAQIAVEAEFEGYENGGTADVRILSPDGDTVYHRQFFRKESYLKEYIDIPDARLWYPAGYGEQPLYKLIISEKEFTFGIRQAVVLQKPDEKDSEYYKKCLEIKDSVSGREYDRNEEFSGFCLIINGIPVMCKGANWVPSEPFPSEESDEKITELLTLAKEAGLNMLRIWGGGIFEKQHFYNECDRLGILLTQDFLMACGEYPEELDSFILQIKKEAEFAAYELRNHPSLVWWSGDNENAVNGFDTAESYHGRTAVHKGILPVLNRLDPKRRFFLSSPAGGNTYASKTVGTTHNTQYLGCSIFPYIMNEDMTDYKEHFSQYLARFIAEEPTTGAICLPSLKKFMTEEDIFFGDKMWNFHTKSNPGLPFSLFDVLTSFTSKVLGSFSDGYDRFFKMKYNQFEWIRVSMENIRRNRGFINGIVYWMWNDCWPASSGWSFIDYYALPKASFYSFKRCAGELLCSIDKKDTYVIYLCNDGLEKKTVELKLSCLKNGEITSISEHIAEIAAHTSSAVLTLPLSALPEDAVLFCDINSGDLSDRAFYKNGSLPIKPADGIKIENITENTVTVSATEYIHAAELEGEYIFSDNFFSLYPGEKKTVTSRRAMNCTSDEIILHAYTLEL
ncbi:MAG: hypothetical protein E7535_07755 [Ruminococcaceae bacterium]|nr:hypothetical protein [Oscillospiraceae bacterium]